MSCQYYDRVTSLCIIVYYALLQQDQMDQIHLPVQTARTWC